MEYCNLPASKQPEYYTWSNMKKRCYNPKDIRYSRYGGRGIKMCDRWLESFWNFLEDVGRKPTLQHTIDRINNDGNYEPGNVKWSTVREQNANRSNSNKIIGVHYVTAKDRYRVTLKFEGKLVCNKTFVHEHDAIVARREAEKKWLGKYLT